MKGRHVRKARERLGSLSQDDLADLIGTSQSKVSRWERQLDARIPPFFSKRITRLLKRVQQGLAPMETPGLPANVIELVYPADAAFGGPRVWIEAPRHRPRTRKDTAPTAGQSSAPRIEGEGGQESPRAEGTSRALFGPAFRWVASVAAATLLASCLIHAETFARDSIPARPTTAAAPAPRTPLSIPAEDLGQEATSGAAQDDSIPMPSGPYDWQKRAPCNPMKGEHEKVGGCWALLQTGPPCPEVAVVSEGKCFVPIPKKKSKPNPVSQTR
ncbi:MAG TPA: helix-turn-helix transcriptional regulator [Myxococcaceae bacterium]|nr:helix-turn-helix transcriptional regulator [Myxococcaceae bacterium]